MARICVIEDEAAIAMALQEALSDAGHKVTVLPDGHRGLLTLRRRPRPDLVLVDLLMPKAGGRAVIAAMRADPELQRIPVILITGAVQGAEDFPPEGSYQAIIGKPFDLVEVLATVQGLLAGSRRAT